MSESPEQKQAVEPRTVSIDGKEYDLDKLSEEARNQIINLRVTDQEIQNLNQRLAIARTARTAYSHALADALPGDTESNLEH